MLPGQHIEGLIVDRVNALDAWQPSGEKDQGSPVEPLHDRSDPTDMTLRRVLLQEAVGPIWYDPLVEDSELVPLDDALWEADLAAWTLECEQSRAAAAKHHLDDTGIRHGTPCSLRWIYVHMIEEYARHNGHADFLRELVEGTVGW